MPVAKLSSPRPAGPLRAGFRPVRADEARCAGHQPAPADFAQAAGKFVVGLVGWHSELAWRCLATAP